MYLQPFFAENEAYIDARITSAKANILKFAQDQLAGLYHAVLNAAGKATGAAPGSQGQGAANPLDSLKSLFSAFGPSFGAALAENQAPVRPGVAPWSSSSSSVSSYMSDSSSSSVPSSSHSSVQPRFPEPKHHS